MLDNKAAHALRRDIDQDGRVLKTDVFAWDDIKTNDYGVQVSAGKYWGVAVTLRGIETPLLIYGRDDWQHFVQTHAGDTAAGDTPAAPQTGIRGVVMRRIVKDDGMEWLGVKTPYYPPWRNSDVLRKLGAEWDGTWRWFYPSQGPAVRNALIDYFGTDGSFLPDTGTVHLVLDALPDKQIHSLHMLGRKIFDRRERGDRGGELCLGPGVTLISGDIVCRIGEHHEAPVTILPNTVLEVSHVPISLIKQSLKQNHGLVVLTQEHARVHG